MTRDDSPMPPVPPFPLDLDANGDMEPHVCTSYVNDLYGTCESKKKGEQGERCEAGVPSASEAKQLWLEREVKSLKQALDRVAVPQVLQQSEFWTGGHDHRTQTSSRGAPPVAVNCTAHGHEPFVHPTSTWDTWREAHPPQKLDGHPQLQDGS